MARFRVTAWIDTRYTVDASSPEEAKSMILSGRGVIDKTELQHDFMRFDVLEDPTGKHRLGEVQR